ncbi:hypothetical protein GOODEAATRI_001500 [Goodea atripinnis]|uniref:Uncharacterized protein n=1 Tax=Goodea atripinnis TaxID=208336 RepID=A0ABV0ME65_9TELE
MILCKLTGQARRVLIRQKANSSLITLEELQGFREYVDIATISCALHKSNFNERVSKIKPQEVPFAVCHNLQPDKMWFCLQCPFHLYTGSLCLSERQSILSLV